MPDDCIHVQLADGRSIRVACVRNPRAKRIKLSVNERGARLSLPLSASLAAGTQFVEQHRDWLAAQLDACGQNAPLLRDATTHLPLRGQHVALHWQPGRFVQLTQHADALYFSCPSTAPWATITRALHDFYRAQARTDLAHWLPTYLPGLPRPPAHIRLRILSSQWGSLTANDVLTLNLALILGQPFAFEYVLVHELCHLIHANHSRAFWSEVETRFPQWRAARDYLHAQGRLLKSQLHALLRG